MMIAAYMGSILGYQVLEISSIHCQAPAVPGLIQMNLFDAKSPVPLITSRWIKGLLCRGFHNPGKTPRCPALSATTTGAICKALSMADGYAGIPPESPKAVWPEGENLQNGILPPSCVWLRAM